MTVDVEELFKLIIYIMLVILVPLLLVELGILLYRANRILGDVRQISSTAATLSKDEKSMQSFVQEVASYTANDIIEKQSANIAKRLSSQLINGLLSFSRK